MCVCVCVQESEVKAQVAPVLKEGAAAEKAFEAAKAAAEKAVRTHTYARACFCRLVALPLYELVVLQKEAFSMCIVTDLTLKLHLRNIWC